MDVLRWVRWTNYGQWVEVSPLDADWDHDLLYPGVYVLARFDRVPPKSDPTPHLHPEVVYIGKTLNIRKRPRSHNKIQDYRHITKDQHLDQLYVSVYKIENWFNRGDFDDRALGNIEKRMLREFQLNYGAFPVLNKRAGG